MGREDCACDITLRSLCNSIRVGLVISSGTHPDLTDLMFNVLTFSAPSSVYWPQMMKDALNLPGIFS